jgi:hypothetical protein
MEDAKSRIQTMQTEVTASNSRIQKEPCIYHFLFNSTFEFYCYRRGFKTYSRMHMRKTEMTAGVHEPFDNREFES